MKSTPPGLFAAHSDQTFPSPEKLIVTPETLAVFPALSSIHPGLRTIAPGVRRLSKGEMCGRNEAVGRNIEIDRGKPRGMETLATRPR